MHIKSEMHIYLGFVLKNVEDYKQELNQIKEILKNNPKGMTVTDIARAVNINRNSVAKYLDVLLVSGQAEMITFGPAKVFFPAKRVTFSKLLNYVSDYIIIIDEDLRVRQVNDILLELLGLAREEIIGQEVHHMILPRLNSISLLQSIKETIQGREYTTESEIIINNETYYFIIHLIPIIFDDEGQGAAIILTDISDKKNIELALQKTKSRRQKKKHSY